MAISLPIVSKFDDKGVNQAESGLNKLGGFAEKAGLAVAAGLAIGATAAIAFGVESLKAAAEAEAVTRGLENAAKNAGVFGDRASGISKATEALDAHSKALGEMSGIDDEIINQIKTGWLAVPSLAALGTEGLNELAQVTADTAAGTGKDVQAIGLAFQRVAGDTESAFSKLTRAGIVFTDEQKATFDSILATNGEMAAQQFLVEELGKKYEGAAEAAANPFDRLDVIFGNLKETIGASLLPAFEEVIPIIQQLLDNLVSDPEFQTFLATMSETLSNMLPRIEPVVTNFNRLMIDLLPGLNPLLDIMGGLLETISLTLPDINAESEDLYSSWKDIAVIIDGINKLLEGFNGFMATIKEDMGPFGIVITSAFDAINRALNPLATGLKAVADLIKWINGTPVKNGTVGSFQQREGGGRDGNPLTPFARGGIVTGPTPALVGEAGPEAIIPLSKFDDVVGKRGGNITINVNAGMGADGAAVGEQVVNAIRKYERTSGQVFARA
jgi:phage-related protein